MTKDQIITRLRYAIRNKRNVTINERSQYIANYKDHIAFFDNVEHAIRKEDIKNKIPVEIRNLTMAANEILHSFIVLEKRLLESFYTYYCDYNKNNDKNNKGDLVFISKFRFHDEILRNIDIEPRRKKRESCNHEKNIIWAANQPDNKTTINTIKQYLITTIALLQKHNNLFVVLYDNYSDHDYLSPSFVSDIKSEIDSYRTKRKLICKLIKSLENEPNQINTKVKRVIIFIHGITGNEDKTWGQFKEIIKTDSFILDHFESPYFVHYDSYGFLSFLSRIASLGKRRHKHRNLTIHELAEVVKLQIDNYVNQGFYIYFVCHSLGGLICQQYLIDLFEKGHDLNQFKSLIFFAVPHTGSDKADLSDIIPLGFDPLHAALKKNSDFLMSLNNLWSKNDISKKINTHFFCGTKDDVVKYEDVKNYFKEYGTEPFGPFNGLDHESILHPNDEGNPSYNKFKDILVKTMK